MQIISKFWLSVILLILSPGAPATPSQGGDYLLNPHVTANGGGRSTNGNYTVTGTIGQHDASVTISSDNYHLRGGFWHSDSLSPPQPDVLLIDGFEN